MNKKSILRALMVAFSLNCAAFAVAHNGGGESFGRNNFRGFGFDFSFGGLGLDLGHHGGFGDFGGLGLGLGFGLFDPDRLQMRFENRFDNLMADYEDGVANTPDFFNTDDYDDVVDDTESLSDKYDFFVTGVERSIDRLGDIIGIVSDDITFYNDLLADYQADPDISEARLARIETIIGHVTDRLDMKLDNLTDAQTTLQDNLPTYQSFQTDVSTFLDDIVAAGEPTDATAAVMKSMNASSAVSTSFASAAIESGVNCDSLMTGSAAATAVPEPATIMLSMLTLVAMAAMRRPRRAH